MSDLDLGTLRGHVDLDVQAFDRKYGQVTSLLKRLSSTPIPDLVIDAATEAAMDELAKVEAATRALPEGAVDVEADAEAFFRDLERITAETRALPDGEVDVTADTSQAKRALEDVEDEATDSGKRAGEGAGGNLAAGIISSIATIPIAGAIVGIGAAIGNALMEGLQNEVREDLFSARTGLDEATAARFGRAAGEAYANNWGESIAANLDTARVAMQAGLLDEDATAREAQAVIESLSGVTDVLGEDIPRTARAAGVLLRTGLARDAQDAFDLITRGAQSGANVAEDLLDTMTEYPAVFQRLGLDGELALGLISQGLRAGARDSDYVADALKEFQIRATDASETSARGYELIGLSAKEMTAQIAAGGEGAKAGLDLVLDGLRAMEDPVLRNEAAVALFGTKAEDLGDALFALDASSAVEQLGLVEGAAKSALDTLGDNSAGVIAGAQRNIEVAADGIKGALATAFAPQIEGFATFVTENREAVLTFLLEAANGAIDFGRSLIEGAAGGTEAVGAFIGGPAADLIDVLADIVLGIDAATPGDQEGQAFREWADGAIEGMRGVEDELGTVADEIRLNLIENGLDPAQAKLNEVGIPLVAQAALHDAAVALANDIDAVGGAAEQANGSIGFLNGTVDLSTAAGQRLDEQLRAVVGGLDEQIRAGVAAGETQEDLQAKYDGARGALMNQLQAMGLTEAQAADLVRQYGLIPERVSTVMTADASQARAEAQALWDRYNGRSMTVYIDAITRNPSGGGGAVSRMFDSGGYTGDGGRLEPAGIVHRGEFVMDADTTARYRPLLEALHAGTVPGYDGGGYVPAMVLPQTAPAAAVMAGDTYVTFQVDASSLRSVADLEHLLQNARRLSRQKAGVR